MSHPESVARRMYDLVEPLGLVPYLADESDEALMSLGLRNQWDAYFAGRAAPFGRTVPAEVGPRGLLQLRPRRGGTPHPAGLGPDHTRGSAGRPRAGMRRGDAADPR